MTFGIIACIASLVSARGRRLGDVFAGTLVVRERIPVGHTAFVPPPPPWLAGRFSGLDLSAVPDGLWLAIRQYLTRMRQLDPQVGGAMAERLASDLAARTGLRRRRGRRRPPIWRPWCRNGRRGTLGGPSAAGALLRCPGARVGSSEGCPARAAALSWGSQALTPIRRSIRRRVPPRPLRRGTRIRRRPRQRRRGRRRRPRHRGTSQSNARRPDSRRPPEPAPNGVPASSGEDRRR